MSGIHRSRPSWGMACLTLMLAVGPVIGLSGSNAWAARRNSTATQASHLAAALTGAKSLKAREQAINNIFRAIHLGVRTGTLGIVVAGGEQKAKDPYLYTDEVVGLADAFGQGHLISFTELTSQFTQDGLVAAPPAFPGFPPTPLAIAAVQKQVQAAEKYWISQQGSPALYAQIIRDLGLERHVDLAKMVLAGKNVIDPVQQILIGLGMAMIAKPVSSKKAASSVDQTLTDGVFKDSARVAGPCDFKKAAQVGSALATAKKWAGKIPGADIAIDADFAVTDILHGMTLGIFVELQVAGSQSVDGNFGTNGPGSARELEFKVRVLMHADLPDWLIRCGALAGYKLPKPGGVPDVRVEFSAHPFGVKARDLEFFGVDASRSTVTTNADGYASYKFEPDDEYLAKTGDHLGAYGVVSADAYTLTSTGNSSGSDSESLGVTKSLPFGWLINWHQPAGYEIEVPSFKVKESFDNGKYTDAWTIKLHHEATCLADNGPLYSHPVQPQATNSALDPMFGNGFTGAPDEGTLTATDVHHGADGNGTHTVNADHVSLPINNVGAQGLDFGLGTDLDSGRVVDTTQFVNGRAQSHLVITFDKTLWPKGYKVTPAQFTFTVPWKDAIGCDKPTLGPPTY